MHILSNFNGVIPLIKITHLNRTLAQTNVIYNNSTIEKVSHFEARRIRLLTQLNLHFHGLIISAHGTTF